MSLFQKLLVRMFGTSAGAGHALHVSWPVAIVAIALFVTALCYTIISLRERRALLNDAYQKAPGGTTLTQKRGAGSPELTLTVGSDLRPAPAPVVTIVVVEHPPGHPPIGRGQ